MMPAISLKILAHTSTKEHTYLHLFLQMVLRRQSRAKKLRRHDRAAFC